MSWPDLTSIISSFFPSSLLLPYLLLPFLLFLPSSSFPPLLSLVNRELDPSFVVFQLEPRSSVLMYSCKVRRLVEFDGVVLKSPGSSTNVGPDLIASIHPIPSQNPHLVPISSPPPLIPRHLDVSPIVLLTRLNRTDAIHHGFQCNLQLLGLAAHTRAATLLENRLRR